MAWRPSRRSPRRSIGCLVVPVRRRQRWRGRPRRRRERKLRASQPPAPQRARPYNPRERAGRPPPSASARGREAASARGREAAPGPPIAAKLALAGVYEVDERELDTLITPGIPSRSADDTGP